MFKRQVVVIILDHGLVCYMAPPTLPGCAFPL